MTFHIGNRLTLGSLSTQLYMVNVRENGDKTLMIRFMVSLLLVLAMLNGPCFAQSDAYTQIDQNARQAMSDKKYSEAFDLAKRAIGIDGSRWEAYNLAGTALVGLQKPSDALNYFQEALNGAPEPSQADINKAIEACRTMIKADSGDATAMNSLGAMYAMGRGVPKDDAQAVSWYRKAADAGDVGGMNNLGGMYAIGLGVPKDDAQAVSWFRKASDAGDAPAMRNLGIMYANGRGVPKDDAQAVVWYRKAADAGVAPAMTNLGSMYENGRGVPKDDGKAVSWYRKAADAGDPRARESLRRLGQ